jgi:hypothetical protein
MAADCSETLYYMNVFDPTLYVTDKNGLPNGSFSMVVAGTTDQLDFTKMAWEISNVILPIIGDGGFSIAADCSETLYYTNEETSELYVADKNGIHNGRFSTVVAGTTDKLVFYRDGLGQGTGDVVGRYPGWWSWSSRPGTGLLT